MVPPSRQEPVESQVPSLAAVSTDEPSSGAPDGGGEPPKKGGRPTLTRVK
jgi:stringent starvation protein B